LIKLKDFPRKRTFATAKVSADFLADTVGFISHA